MGQLARGPCPRLIRRRFTGPRFLRQPGNDLVVQGGALSAVQGHAKKEPAISATLFWKIRLPQFAQKLRIGKVAVGLRREFRIARGGVATNTPAIDASSGCVRISGLGACVFPGGPCRCHSIVAGAGLENDCVWRLSALFRRPCIALMSGGPHLKDTIPSSK